ncbi:uncharacterized protein HMPREF1541_10205 [Cyphellophora europaea CBS 101466]|uniref:Uncharacterized protein n=1 Tax=Cyphellophora europaea (strain CBS 101466) TaxID=1220924 RepID=W2S7D3_CYPE1|nr:uncharacterized protein HMPREF1541_10205 [Cyphellophora europaea CBS 101466]ETN44535.1 hypothetical protein HMPREF1541_10205 [Cyphellophora europaea CBS 101466]
MPSANRVTLPEENIDDLIYLARASELTELQSTLEDLTKQHSCTPTDLLSAAIEPASGNSLLHYPAANGAIALVSHLLSLVQPQHAPSSTATSKPAPQVAQILNHSNASGNTPLHWAALNGHLEVVQALVTAGADPGVRNGAGRDVIVEAEMSGKEEGVKCAEWLLGSWEGVESGVGGAEVAEGDETSAVDGEGSAGAEIKEGEHKDEEASR